ncbi:MAG: hypothetical protein J3K34DRAFT_490011 [Monoraphidium minutum]|nr:MAG: hypothetical protein J3K34DRAFT_490011 [Monoraphidium minutum]
MDQGPLDLAGGKHAMTASQPKSPAGGWQGAGLDELRASLAAGPCSDAQLELATQVVAACATACSSWQQGGGPDAGPLGDQTAEACSQLAEACQLAAAACKGLADACGADEQRQPDQQPPQPPQPPPVRIGAVGGFACACLTLAHAVLCSADVAAPLVHAGQHGAAADGARAGVKHLVAALEALCAQRQAGCEAGGGEGGAGGGEQQELWAVVAAACRLLLGLALAATTLATGGGPPGAPREMRSLATLNLGWSCLGRLMSAPPPPARGDGGGAAAPALVRRAARAALRQLVAAADELRAPGQEGRLRVVRFWLGSALKVLSASPAAARGAAWAELASAALALHAADRAGFAPSEAAAAGAVRELLLPKLAAAMLGALNEGGGAPRELEARLLELAAVAEGRQEARRQGEEEEEGGGAPDDEGGGWGPIDDDPALRLQAGVLLGASLLQHAPAMQPSLAEAAARALLPWVLRAAAGGAAGAALSEHPGGLWRHARCAALAFLLGCAAGGPALDAAWRRGVREVQVMAVGPHPLASRLAGAVLCGALQASAPAPQAAQLEGALALLDELCAAEALSGACRLDARGAAWRVPGLLASMMQACIASPAARQFAQQRLLSAPPAPCDACAAAAMAGRVHAARLARLPPAADAGRFFSGCLELAAGEARRAAAALQQQGAALNAAEAALLEAQLGWLLEAAQLAAQELQGADGAAGPHPSLQQAAAAALAALELPSSGASPTPAAAGRPAPACYVGPALRLVAAAGALLQAPALESLLQPLDHLSQRAAQRPGLLADVAAAAGRLGGAHTQPQALFRALLSAPHWAVRAAALDALVLYSRTSAVHGTFLGLIPPDCMAAPGAAAPGFVAVFKSHMARQPDEQARGEGASGAQRAHGEWARGGGMERLGGALLPLAPAPPPDGRGGGFGAAAAAAAVAAAPDPFPEGVEPLLRSYIEHRGAVAAGVQELGRALASLAAEAKAGVAALEQAVSAAEAAVGRLLAAARGAGPLPPDERALVAAHVGKLLGELTSVTSRARGLRDGVEGARGELRG